MVAKCLPCLLCCSACPLAKLFTNALSGAQGRSEVGHWTVLYCIYVMYVLYIQFLYLTKISKHMKMSTKFSGHPRCVRIFPIRLSSLNISNTEEMKKVGSLLCQCVTNIFKYSNICTIVRKSQIYQHRLYNIVSYGQLAYIRPFN